MLQRDKSDKNVLVPGGRSSHTLHIQPLQQVYVPFRRTDLFDSSFRQRCKGHHRDALHYETRAEIRSAEFQSDFRGLKRKVSLRGRVRCDVSTFQTEAHLILFKAVLHLLFSRKERR